MLRRGIGRRGPGLLGAAATTAVVVGTAGAVSNAQHQRQAASQQQAEQQAAWEAQQQQAQIDAAVAAQMAAQAPAPAPAPAAAPAASAGDTIQQLKDLAELKAAGILTEEEFAAQKARILGS